MSERKPYPELDCAVAMSKARGNLNFLVKRIAEEWHETDTTAQAVLDAHTALVEAQKEYKKVLTLLKQINTMEL